MYCSSSPLVKGAKKKEWNSIDKKYEAIEAPPAKKIDWTGQQARRGPASQRAAEEKPATKKLFGLF